MKRSFFFSLFLFSNLILAKQQNQYIDNHKNCLDVHYGDIGLAVETLKDKIKCRLIDDNFDAYRSTVANCLVTHRQISQQRYLVCIEKVN